jgi:superfamily II DNA or RNA helicase/very-short-patch-repair endonuclease
MEATCRIDNRSSAKEKIALFRSLFRGRPDVYARRFVSGKTGKAGYSPACGNEWVRGVCEKPRVKCSDCTHRLLLPLIDEAIRWHLSGQDGVGREFVAGIYPMLTDETCFFLAADFDKASWQEDARAFLDTCRFMGVPAVLERSRSGNGGHVWLFFAEAVPAALARKLGTYLLTETMERRPDLGLDSYDRLFPNQDTLPQGGFGNLIALPLQKRPREQGNSVFLDEGFSPYPDQWQFLSGLCKISRSEIERLVQDGQAKGNLLKVRPAMADEDGEGFWLSAEPWYRHAENQVVGPIPEKLELVLANELYIRKDALTPSLRNRILRLAAFQNPEFYRAQSMHLSTYGKPRIIACAREYPSHISVPRGCCDELLELLADLGVRTDLRDERESGRELDVTFHGQLRPEQEAAAAAMLEHDTGVLAATTAFGKTVLAAWLIAKRRVNTLILVHRRQLQEQWIERLSTFLRLPARSIGRIGGGRKKATGLLDVAVIQSLIRKGAVDDRIASYGQVIVDECHHVSAASFEEVTRQARAKFVVGLSATVTRKDGHHPIILMQCGPIRHRVSAKEQASERQFEHLVFVRPTGFEPLRAANPNVRIQFHDLYDELIRDAERNGRICDDVIAAVREGRSPLVLTERNEHLDELAGRLRPAVRNVIVLRGGMGKKQLQEIRRNLAAISNDDARVLLATGRYVGEGFDDPRLDALFLTLPVSWHGTIAQYVGRLHREHEGKREVCVYDYADLEVPMLARMFNRRCRGYENVGYKILLPASAVPGWPVDVPLPVDPLWKGQYAATVRRLVRDGVDARLANLFIDTARAFPPNAEGLMRARSAAERFLFRRLETLPELAGKFQLNVELPITLDGWGRMEVDLLCQEPRLAIELDGAQHFGDLEAYRRDRRKDAFLQENGYFVLRFLTEDVSERLDNVLDTINRTITHQRG